MNEMNFNFKDTELLDLIKSLTCQIQVTSPLVPGCPLPTVRVYGGYIRDSLLGLQPRNIDLEVYGVPPIDLWEHLADYFPGQVSFAGTRYQVLQVVLPGSFKLNVHIPQEPNLYAPFLDGQPRLTPSQAARQKDFTVNALSFCPLTEQVFDYLTGLDDFQEKLVRHCDDQRAKLDPDMPFRAVRLAATLGYAIADETHFYLRNNINEGFPIKADLAKLAVTHFRELLDSTVGFKRQLVLMNELSLLEKHFTFFSSYSEQEKNQVFNLCDHAFRDRVFHQIDGLAKFSTLVALLLTPLARRNPKLSRELIQQELHLSKRVFQLSNYHLQFITTLLSDISCLVNEQQNAVLNSATQPVSTLLAPLFMSAPLPSEFAIVSASPTKLSNIPQKKRKNQRVKLRTLLPINEDLISAHSGLFKVDLEKQISQPLSCTIRYQLKSNYTVEVPEIFYRDDLYQYHVQRVELLACFLERTLAFMRKHAIPIKDSPLWIHVNDGLPPTRGLPIFCFAQPKEFNNGILFPDWSFISSYNSELTSDWDNYQEQIVASYGQTPWHERHSQAFFSGRNTTKKLGIRDLVARLASKRFKIVVADDDNYQQGTGDTLEGIESWGNYRYLLDLPGAFPWSVRFKELFLFGGVVFKIDLIDTLRKRSRWVNFYNDLLIEGEDYFRFDLNYTGDPDDDQAATLNVLKQIESTIRELELNPKRAQQIAESGRRKIRSLTLERVFEHCAYLILRYQETFF